MKYDFCRMNLVGFADAREKALYCLAAHFFEGLPDRCEAWGGETSYSYVVEADNGHVAWAVQTEVGEGSNGADGGSVVEGAYTGKSDACGEMFGNDFEGELRSHLIVVDLETEFRSDLHIEFPGCFEQQAPALSGFEAGTFTLHQQNALMAEIVEMLQREVRAQLLVDDDACDAGVEGGIGDGNGRDAGRLDDTGAEKDEAVDGALPQQQRIFADEIFTQHVADGEVKIAAFEESFFNAPHHPGVVAVTGVGSDDADSVALAGAERAGDEIRTIVELFRGGQDALSRLRREGMGQRDVVEDHRDGSERKTQMLGNFLEARWLRRSAALNCLSLDRVGRFAQGFGCRLHEIVKSGRADAACAAMVGVACSEDFTTRKVEQTWSPGFAPVIFCFLDIRGGLTVQSSCLEFKRLN